MTQLIRSDFVREAGLIIGLGESPDIPVFLTTRPYPRQRTQANAFLDATQRCLSLQ
jgi:hypothetical protein